MERLTIRLNNQHGNPTDSIILKPYMRYQDEQTKKIILNRLAEYEDAEEQWLLIKPPCKIGDTIYWLRADNQSIPRILPIEVVRYATKEDRPSKRYTEEVKTVYNGFSKRFPVSEFGKTLFLTKEEAEQALKGVVGKR